MDEVRTIVHWGLLHPAIPDETPPTSKTVKTWAGCFFAATRLCWEYRLEYFWISGPGGVHYIHTLLTTVTADKCIQVYASHKPWMTREVRTLFSNRNTAFRSDTWNCTMQPRQTWTGASDRPSWIITTKDHLQNNNLRQLWLGVQNITNYNPRPRAVDGDVVLAET